MDTLTATRPTLSLPAGFKKISRAEFCRRWQDGRARTVSRSRDRGQSWGWANADDRTRTLARVASNALVFKAGDGRITWLHFEPGSVYGADGLSLCVCDGDQTLRYFYA